ncbi:hypothetical protein [Emticicia aquatilis]|uniref:hypothetical protein n=1 Tax=Emticicia aquatilis TaxID=1537369 RepID=UPI0016640CFD|nr:hypothetical protein [Emticicia aquatilis]
MKRNTARLHFAGILSFIFFCKTAAQIQYRTRSDIALSAEIGGISPFLSANFEFVPYKAKNSFGVIRAGVGFKSNSTSQAVSVPFSLTYNFLLNKKKDCDAAPQKVFKERFLETGLGLSYVSSLGQRPVLYLAPIVGLRKQFIKWGKSDVFFYKIHLTPIYAEQHFRFGAGLSLGHSL